MKELFPDQDVMPSTRQNEGGWKKVQVKMENETCLWCRNKNTESKLCKYESIMNQNNNLPSPCEMCVTFITNYSVAWENVFPPH